MVLENEVFYDETTGKFYNPVTGFFYGADNEPTTKNYYLENDLPVDVHFDSVTGEYIDPSTDQKFYKSPDGTPPRIYNATTQKYETTETGFIAWLNKKPLNIGIFVGSIVLGIVLTIIAVYFGVKAYRNKSKSSSKYKEVPDRKEVSPKKDGKEVSPKEDGKEVSPKKDGKEVSPKKDGKEVSPKKDGKEVSPKEDGKEVSPKEDGKEVSPKEDGKETPSKDGDGKASSKDGDGKANDKKEVPNQKK
jgi:hypothetical protein